MSEDKSPEKIVNVTILNLRPKFPEKVVFINTYKAVVKENQDLKEIFMRAFQEAHPNWKILDVKINNE